MTVPCSILRTTALKKEPTNSKEPVTEKETPTTLETSFPTPPTVVAVEENTKIAFKEVTTPEQRDTKQGG